MSVEPKNWTSQEGDGSPAQIWTALDSLAREIFGSIDSARFFAEMFEEINGTAVSSAVVQELPGFECPTAECDMISTHNTPHTTHRTMI